VLRHRSPSVMPSHHCALHMSLAKC